MLRFSDPGSSVDKGLRARLLLSSVFIAVIVSVVSMIVAYRVSVDMGENYELRSLNSHADSILYQLKRDREPASIKQMVQDTTRARKIYLSLD